MGVIQIAARMLGKSPQEVEQAYSKAKKMIGNAPQTISGAAKVLKDNGISGGFVDNAIKFAKPIAKAAKFMGVKELKGMDIDEMAEQAKQMTAVIPNPAYASYDRRNSPVYQSQSQNNNRTNYKSGNLPD